MVFINLDNQESLKDGSVAVNFVNNNPFKIQRYGI
jgi:hypothetical protein